MEQFFRQTGVLAPLCFLLLQTIQVVILVVPGGVSCIIGVPMFGPLYGFFLNYAGMVTGSVISFLLALILPSMPDDLLCLIAGLTSMSMKNIWFHPAGMALVPAACSNEMFFIHFR